MQTLRKLPTAMPNRAATTINETSISVSILAVFNNQVNRNYFMRRQWEVAII